MNVDIKQDYTRKIASNIGRDISDEDYVVISTIENK